MSPLPEIPSVFAVLLIAGSFFFGHYTQQLNQTTTQLPSVTLGDAPELNDMVAGKHLQRRDLRELSPRESRAQASADITPPIDPLDPAQLERFMLESSGLLKVRPALKPAPSGDDFVRVIPFQILSWMPRVVVYPAFIDAARCNAIIQSVNVTMYKSGVAFRPGEGSGGDQQIRTSTGTYISSASEQEGGPLAWLEERLAAASLLPSVMGEAFNVLHYQNNQYYESHMDTFDPKEYGPQNSQRIATMILYLSDVEEGGETVFKKEGWNGEKRDVKEWRQCNDNMGLKYKPRMGDMVLFWATMPNGDIDPHALHGSCPVKKGEKWVATKWMRNIRIMSQNRAADLEQARKEAEAAAKGA